MAPSKQPQAPPVWQSNDVPPPEWRGSNLREREEVVHYLLRSGGSVAADDGLVAGRMRDELGKGRAFGQLLKAMEDDGMIERELNGRRTFRIALVPDNTWGLDKTFRPNTPRRLPPVPRVERSASDDDDAVLYTADGEVDYTRMAHRLLDVVVQQGKALDGLDPKDVRASASKLRQLERERDKAQREVRELTERLREANEKLAAERELVTALRASVKELDKQASQRQHRSDRLTQPVAELVSDETRAGFKDLMRAPTGTRG